MFYKHCRPQIIHGLITIICLIIAYWRLPTLSFLIGWDDQWFVTNHYTEGGVTIKNTYQILNDFYYGQYAPVNQMYYTILYSLIKYKESYYHLAQVTIHLINSFLVYSLVLNLCKQFHFDKDLNKYNIAFLTMLFFATSPLNMESVVWVSASKVTLYGFFYLLAIRIYMVYIQYNNSKDYYISAFFFILSFGAKEQAITFLPTMFLLDYVVGRDFKQRTIWYEKVPIAIITILFILVTFKSQGIDLDTRENFYPIYQRVLLAGFTGVEYLVKMILPINLSYLYPFPFLIGDRMPFFLWIYPFIISLIIFLLKDRFKAKWMLFGIVFFLIHICLVLNLISLARHSVIADRYSYISSISIYFILSTIILKIVYNVKQRTLLSYSVYGFVITYVICFIIYINLHSITWKNSITLKEKIRTAIEKREDYKRWIKSEKHDN